MRVQGPKFKVQGLAMLSLALVAAKPASDWPQRYNDGVTAYRTNDFTSAASAFEQATASADRALQQRAFYNLGNASYRLGEANQTQAMPFWERALKNYETALALDPKDEDARFNLDLVKKKIEELKKQQEQQQQQQQDKKEQDQNKDEKKDQQQQQPQNQQGQQQQQDQKQDQQPQNPEEKQKPEQEPAQQQQKGDKDQQQAQPQPGQTNNFEQIQARALLDNLREDERNWNFFPEVQMKELKDGGEPEKDW